jgi:hypothetical protein
MVSGHCWKRQLEGTYSLSNMSKIHHIALEKGIPIPPRKSKPTGRKGCSVAYDWFDILEPMEVGDSFTICLQSVTGRCAKALKKLGYKIVVRDIGSIPHTKFRVWRIA